QSYCACLHCCICLSTLVYFSPLCLCECQGRLKLTVLSEDRLQMKWKEADGPIQGYKVRVRPISEVPQPELMLTTTRGRATVAGLDSSQEYALQVLVLNGTTEKLLAKRRFTSKNLIWSLKQSLLILSQPHPCAYHYPSPPEPLATETPSELPDEATEKTCESDAAAEIMLLVDGSWSIGRTNFRRVRDFLEGLVTPFHIGPNHIQIGLIQYSGDPRTEWHLNNFTTKDQLLEAVRNFRYKGGNTFTGQALLHVMEENMRAEAGARSDTPLFLVLLTDGKSQDDAIAAANRLKNAGVEIIAVGVKNADEAELRQVASEPVDLNVYNVNDFPLLSKLVARLVHILCGRIEDRGISKRMEPAPTDDPALSYPSPTDLRFSELGSREVKLHWTNPAQPVQQYRVVYHSAEGQRPQEVRNPSTVLLEGLSSQTLYHVSIFPVYENDVGLALRGTVTTCKTGITIRYCILKDLFVHQSHLSLDVSQSILKLNSGHLDDMLLKVPSPSDLRVSNFSGSDITVRWGAAADDVVSYLIKWISLSGGDLRQLRVSGESEGAILEGVEDDKEYQISLSALYGDGAQSEAVAIRYSTCESHAHFEQLKHQIKDCHNVVSQDIHLTCLLSGFDMMEAFGLTQSAHSSVEGVAAEPFVFNTLPTYTLFRDVQLTQSTKFIHPAGFSPEHTISIAFRVLQDTPREPFALWQLTDDDFQPKMGVVLDPTTKHLVYFSLDYRGEVQELTFDHPQVRRLFYGSFHKVHLSVSQVSVSLSVDCQRVGERPARPLGSLPTDGFEMLGKLVKTRGPNSGSAPFQLQSFEIVCNTTWASEDTCCDLPALRDEESCPALAYTCTCSSDVPGAPGSPGPTGKPGPRGEKGEKGDNDPSLPLCLFSSLWCVSQGIRGVEGNIGAPGLTGPRGFQGLPGYPGPLGERGRSGPVGPTGLSGGKGERGEKGEPQSMAMIYQLVTQACEQLVRSLAFSEEVLKLDMFINEIGRKPAPIEEPVGPPGEPGIPGPKGPPGTRGSQGNIGTRGRPGRTGYPGEQGKTRSGRWYG
uniref:Uncharacterized protein n=1 Tax=Scophthalmus maximus TaxID=52904 RepID=A0A8D3CP68_SCOMX